jgi:tRNA pseudouridine55 synthase
VHGVLIIDKPAGFSSHDVVARVRRLTGEQRVGHAGTLDPAATGVLPVCVGQATRLVAYLSAADKTYVTEIVLGVQTETDDLEGQIVRTAPVPGLDRARIDAVLAGFVGSIPQLPPAYAAIKVGGKRLYEVARAGQVIDVVPRPVTIHRLLLLAWRPPVLTLLVACSKGTYIRSLARDIGMAIGCGGHVHSLCRVQAGPYCLAEAWSLADLSDRCTPETWPSLALHPDTFLADWPALDLGRDAAAAWRHGNAVAGPATADGVLARCYGPDGAFLGTGRYDSATARWQPEKVVLMGDDM